MKAPKFDPTWHPEVIALYRHDMQEIWDSSIASHIWNCYHSQLDLYFNIANSGSSLDILDVGCAQGTLSIKLAEMGHRVLAVDLRQEFLDYAFSRYEYGNIDFLQANVLELEVTRRFDLIFANQILEHLVYPAELIGRLKQFLKPHGRLIVTTPNGDYLKNPLPSYTELGDPRQWEHMQFTADGDGHFFAYLESELRSIFLGVGFSSIETKFFETPWISGHMKIRYLHNIFPAYLLRMLDRMLVNTPAINRMVSHQLMVIGTL